MDKYFSNSRPEMLSFILKAPTNVLDIGCGNGAFGRSLKQMFDCTVTGIEPIESVGLFAKSQLDHVYIGTFEKVLHSLAPYSFDLIILNDSLEHMTQPEFVLQKIKYLLGDQGALVLSVPNVRYVENVFNLIIKKDWQYTEYGVLDKTHLRFFTQKSLIRLLRSNGFHICKIHGINATKSRIFRIINFITFGILGDMRWLQIAVSAKNIAN